MTYPSQAQMVLPCYCNLFDFFNLNCRVIGGYIEMPTTMNTVKFQKMGTCSCVAIELVNLDYFIFFGILRSKRGLTTLKSTTQRQTTNPPKAIYANSNQKSLSPRYTGSHISNYSLQFYYRNSRLIIYSSKKKTWHPVDPSLTKI